MFSTYSQHLPNLKLPTIELFWIIHSCILYIECRTKLNMVAKWWYDGQLRGISMYPCHDHVVILAQNIIHWMVHKYNYKYRIQLHNHCHILLHYFNTTKQPRSPKIMFAPFGTSFANAFELPSVKCICGYIEIPLNCLLYYHFVTIFNLIRHSMYSTHE